MNIFVTGAGGFIGHHFVRHLQACGHSVHALVRPGGKAPAGTTAHVGDLCAPAQYVDALHGMDAVVHLAARYVIGPANPAEMVRSNVDGTRALLAAAAQAGVPCTVHVSSTAALGETHGAFADESHRHNGTFRTLYEQTKHVAHALAVLAQQRGEPVRIAVPGGVFGVGDTSALAQGVAAFCQGKMPVQVATESRFQLCPVADLCDGLYRVLRHGKPGQSYVLAGAATSMPELFEQLAALCHKPVPRAVAPGKLRAVAALMDGLRRLGLNHPLSREALRVMDGSTYLYSSAKAEAELGWPARRIAAGFATDWADYVRAVQSGLPTLTKAPP